MIYLLITWGKSWLAAHGLLKYVWVFTYVEFRALCALLLSFAFVLVMGQPTIRWLVRMKIGDSPQFYNADLNELTKQKANTPTMGGVLIVGAILLSTLLLANIKSYYVVMALICLLWMAAVGMWDDWLKLTSARRKPGSREGLFFWEKMVFQLGLAVVLGLCIYHYGFYKLSDDPNGVLKMSHSLNLPLLKSWVRDRTSGQFTPSPDIIVLGQWSFVLLATLVITGTSNAVNLTDGMDGLASGIAAICALAFVVLAFIAGDVETPFLAAGHAPAAPIVLAKELLVPHIPLAEELAVVAAAMVGSCLAFLWFNCHPARVFMGDTGSLALGGLLGFIAVVIRQEVLLMVIGGVFVAEAVSVIVQVGYFKWSGRRVFRMAPIHHHFHLSGWTEQQVVVRFWIISAILAALALATIKLR